MNDNSSWELGCFFSFYNYGGDIRLFNGGWEDAFVTVGELSFMHEIKENKDILTINERYEDDKYGEWAIAEVMIGSNTFKEVFVSPLAMKEYNEGESSGFIFFQLVGANKCLNAIYYGSNQHSVILSHFFKSIRNGISMNVDCTINGPGRLWQDINNN